MTHRERFEELLSESLRRLEPPPELEGRILSSIRRRRAVRRTLWMRVAAAVILTFMVWFALRWREERRREQQALEVRQKLAFALQVAYEELLEIDEALNRIGVREIRFEEVGP